MSIVSEWFGDSFKELDPQLQNLHLNGGVLSGQVDVRYGRGIAGVIGQRLGKKLGLPNAVESTSLLVTITHDDQYLHWNRVFATNSKMVSMFKPLGTYPAGRWVETTGLIAIEMNVEIKDGGWHWKPVAYKVGGVTLPSFLFPKSTAYKKIVDDRYYFSVKFGFPVIGMLLSYSGALQQA